jgi:hypothetical protein
LESGHEQLGARRRFGGRARRTAQVKEFWHGFWPFFTPLPTLNRSP